MRRYMLLAVVIIFAVSLLLTGLDVSSRYPSPPKIKEISVSGLEKLDKIHVILYPQNKEANLEKILEQIYSHTISDKNLIIAGEEKAIIFLPGLKLKNTFSYTLGRTIATMLEVEKTQEGSIIIVSGLRPYEEIYLLQKDGASYIMTPIARAVSRDQVLTIRGRADNCKFVEVYAYRAAEDFNASLPPDPYLWLNNATVIGNQYELRVDLSSGPASRTGRPLLSENRVLLIYGVPLLANQSWTFISLEELGEEKNVTVNITCAP